MAHRAIVIGTGFGARVHVPALRAAGFEVVALVGTDPERTKRRAKRLDIAHGLCALDEALALPGIDTVTIATPPDLHAPQALVAIAAGMHLICEKPFTLDALEARRVLEAAESAGVVHRLGYEFRWASDRAVAARAIAQGLIGEPRLASFVSHAPLLSEPHFEMPGWWWRRERGGGWLLASGSHLIDQIRVWLGEIEWVSADVRTISRGADVADDSFAVLARTRAGASVTLQQTGAAPGPMSGITRVVGTTGSLWIQDGEVHVADAHGTRTLSVPLDLELPPEPEASVRSSAPYTRMELTPYIRLCESLRDAIDGKSDPTVYPAPPTFADGLASMRVLDAIRDAAVSGRRVRVETSDE
jgi:predicted dehydrogenase